MTIKISAVISGEKVSVVIDASDELAKALKIQVCNRLANQMNDLQSLEISEG